MNRRRGELEADLQGVTERIELANQTPHATQDLARELATLDNIWDNLFPGEQQQLVRTIFERATLHTDRFEITLRAEAVQHIVGLMVGNEGDGKRLSASQDSSGRTTVSIPIQFKRRNSPFDSPSTWLWVAQGRLQEIVLPEEPQQNESALLIALARAFRWKDLLDSGRFTTVKALAEAVGLERSYVARMLNLTLLSPKIIDAIAWPSKPAGRSRVAGNEPGGLSVVKLRQGVAVRWDEQT